MSISFDKALGIHEKALGFRAQRAEVLANNVANADTPNYKARDLEFAAVLNGTTPASAFDVWPHVFLARDLDALARFLEGRTRPAV